MSNNKTTGLLLVLATAIISGFAVFINKFGVKEVNPYVFTFVKNLIASLPFLFLAIPAFKQLKKLSLKEKWLFYSIAIIGGSIPFLLFFKGLSMATAINASFIHKTMFLYIALFGVYFLKEKINFISGAGIAILLTASLLFFKINPSKIGTGELYILIATLLWVGEILISKKLLAKVSANLIGFSRMFLGSVVILSYLILSNQSSLLLHLNSNQWKWLLIGGVLLFGYVITFYHGLKRVSATEASAVMTLAVPITTLLSMWHLGKGMTAREEWAIAVFILGIIIIYFASRFPTLRLVIARSHRRSNPTG